MNGKLPVLVYGLSRQYCIMELARRGIPKNQIVYVPDTIQCTDFLRAMPEQTPLFLLGWFHRGLYYGKLYSFATAKNFWIMNEEKLDDFAAAYKQLNFDVETETEEGHHG